MGKAVQQISINNNKQLSYSFSKILRTNNLHVSCITLYRDSRQSDLLISRLLKQTNHDIILKGHSRSSPLLKYEWRDMIGLC